VRELRADPADERQRELLKIRPERQPKVVELRIEDIQTLRWTGRADEPPGWQDVPRTEA
jgi:hypothetical protein